MSSNLPPGITADMLPGNRPEDLDWDVFLEKFCDEIIMSGVDLESVIIASKMFLPMAEHIQSVLRESRFWEQKEGR